MPSHHDKALLFANGDFRDGLMVRRALQEGAAGLHIAADGGARIARAFGVTPNVIIGDMDSIDPALLESLAAQGTTVLRHPPAKDETDLELALLYAAEQGAAWMRIVGAVGDRLDQTMSNVYLLALPALRGIDVRLVTGREETLLLMPGTVEIAGEPGDTVSLVPISGNARGVRTDGLEYPLNDEDLMFGPARGVSNVMTRQHAHITLREGVLIVVHTLGRA